MFFKKEEKMEQKKQLEILVVDDDEQNIGLLSRLFNKVLGNDVEIIVAKDEISATTRCGIADLVIVIVECSLPTSISPEQKSIRFKGVDIIKSIRGKRPELIVVAMSSCDKMRQEAKKSGANFFINTIYDNWQLENIIRASVSQTHH